MARYKIWNKTDTLYAPTGAAFTAEQILEKYGWANLPDAKAIINDGHIGLGVFMEFDATKEFYARQGVEFTEGMTDDEVLAAIEAWEDRPRTAAASAEERTAAALEFLAMNSLPDME